MICQFFSSRNYKSRRQLTNTKESDGKYHVRIYMNDVCGCAKHQENATCGLRYKSTLQISSDIHVSSHPPGANDAANDALAVRNITDDFERYVLHYTPTLSNQKL